MSNNTEAVIRSRSRRAYERARAGNALALAGIVAIPAVLFSAKCCSTPAASIICGLALAAVIAVARFAGKGSEAALRPGLLAGGLAFVLPLLCHGLMACPDGMCLSPRLRWVPFVAAAAGFIGGAALRWVPKGGSRVVAGFTAVLLGSLGSVVVGLSGVLWTALGVGAGSLVFASGTRKN
jgi:hypothetical protein